MKSKYDNYYYWENIVKKDMSDNPFAFEPITEKSDKGYVVGDTGTYHDLRLYNK